MILSFLSSSTLETLAEISYALRVSSTSDNWVLKADSTYGEPLKNGLFTPVVLVPETTIGDEIVPAQWVPKDLSLYYDSEKENIAMDKSLQLILIESLDLVMYNNIVNFTSGK